VVLRVLCLILLAKFHDFSGSLYGFTSWVILLATMPDFTGTVDGFTGMVRDFTG
jgi:hypothetical protein